MNDNELKNYKVDNGVLVTGVKNFSRAYNQRIIQGIVITSADRKDVNSVSDLKSIIEKKKGQAVLLRVVDSQSTSRFVGIEIPK